MEWTEIIPGRHWARWLSRWGSGEEIDGSGVTFTGTLDCGRRVARTYDGREWLHVGSAGGGEPMARTEETFWLVKKDGTFFEQDGHVLFTLEDANALARSGLSITPAFIRPVSETRLEAS